MGRIDDLWPLFGLRIRTEGLELRPPTDDDLAELADLTREPIHAPDQMPFFEPWTDQPEDRRVRGSLQWHWRTRADWTADAWRLELVAVRDGAIVGTQGIHADHFARLREVETGSWVGRRYQGQGVGKAMRRAVLHLAFAGLDARSARSAAFSDNGASHSVSTQLGYVTDGSETRLRRGEPATLIRFLMTREVWQERSASWPAVQIEGLERCRAEFGSADV
jgi:RimJ/RimL family protein N-acetyltransferase